MDSYVVTTREALRLLGVRPASLEQLERSARIERRRLRRGYNLVEMRRLLRAMKMAVAGQA